MSKPIKLLTTHEGMDKLFPSKPMNWEFIDGGSNLEEVLQQNGSSIDILITASIIPIDKQMLDQLPNLKMVGTISSGFSTIDLHELKLRKIAAVNAPGLNSADVADIAASMMTSLLLEFPKNQDFILSNQWTKEETSLRHSIRNEKVGIVGMGAVGKEIAKRLSGFGLDLHWWGPRPKPDINLPYMESIELLAAKCRGLIVCCRPDASTHHLIDQNVLEKLGTDGVIVNVSRGNVINQSALISALENNKIGGAGLDVFDPEPTTATTWENVPNVILSPHKGGATYESLFQQSALIQENIELFLAGKPLLTPISV